MGGPRRAVASRWHVAVGSRSADRPYQRPQPHGGPQPYRAFAAANDAARRPDGDLFAFALSTACSRRGAATERGEARQAPPAAPDYGPNDFQAYWYNAQATLQSTRDAAQHLQRRRDRRTWTDRSSEYGGRSVRADSGRAVDPVQRGMMTQNMRATARYGYPGRPFPDASAPVFTAFPVGHGMRLSEQTAEIGMTYGRPVSVTRPDGFRCCARRGRPDASRPAAHRATPAHGLVYRLVGNASATYIFAKTWQAGASYRRGVDYVPGLPEPVLPTGSRPRSKGASTRRLDAARERRLRQRHIGADPQ